MGVDFEFTVVTETKEKSTFFIQEAIKETVRIENLISSWKATSQTSKITRNAGVKPVKVSRELVDLIARSKRISELTNGCFDISFASLDKLWYFNKPMKKLPDSTLVLKSIKNINYKDIRIDKENNTVFLVKKGMKIGFGSIGKGYAAEKVKEKLKKLGVKAGLVNAGGDLTTWGNHPITEKWAIKIADPNKVLKSIASFNLYNNGVVTSGNYAKYIEFNGIKYSHIIHPKTGWPVKGLKSVTVFCENTELGDALATSVYVMGKEKGLALINQLKGVECLLVTNKNNIYTSTNLKLN
ncbi:FAD:protein FMN transferase [Tenacibaculum pacificus]|uniref:FAD:protein FMN transferase n=1 Tax=Tenacibaculum pacificus TaxID=3018314 RepID=UPI0022F39E17|nr:FAD:protein FMN transferase [Tenacibaculum pacificus]WBX72543.1 FAD:protein FMN transferase [Tenacibaculum pacificus]